MKVAITGGSGRLGSLVASGRPPGCEVRSVDTASPKMERNDFRRVDVCDLASVRNALKDMDAVIHLAAIISPDVAPPEQVFRINALGTYNITLACESLAIDKIVYASSICYYGYLFRKDFTAPPYFPVDELTPSFPEDSYSLSKRVGEAIMQAFVQRTGGAVASLRFCYLMEDGATGGKISPVHGADMPVNERMAKSWWTYVDLRDAARVTWQALQFLEGRHNLHEAFNIGADDTHTLAPTARLIAQFFPGAELRFDSIPESNPYTTLYSNTKARCLLGFAPSTPTWRNIA